MTLLEVLEVLNAKGSPFIVPEPEETPTREEVITELSDLDYYGQHERFTPAVPRG